MSDFLKPCPFCGGDAVMHKASVGDYVFKVKCIKCETTSGGTAFENNGYNISKWNTRHLTPAQQLADEMYSELSGEVDFLIELLNKLIPRSSIADEVSGRIKTIEDILAKARGEHDNN